MGSPAVGKGVCNSGADNQSHTSQTSAKKTNSKQPVKYSSLNKDTLSSATINITMNPYNAEISDEEVWKVNPCHPNISLKSSLQLLEQQRKKTPEQTAKPFMGQSALEMRSPETRRKRNGIVTNPTYKAKGINSVFYIGMSTNGGHEDESLSLKNEFSESPFHKCDNPVTNSFSVAQRAGGTTTLLYLYFVYNYWRPNITADILT
ncbi:uncharacterized protein LOC132721894 [Ruditapes philippinarum]|uniref:uncharacterized protein LOC132721894 n=1 Tax=Ruditapes philippinarum TaxID=129788 RepID=UPI00295B51CA|nr:uncharacterized protein LOC132721894 [Ruditapes philippinarum]